jgi:hypothetical protein
MRLRLIATTAFVTLAGLSACGMLEEHPSAPADDEVTETSAEADPTEGAEESTEADPTLEAIVGTWEADYEDVGPHGSTLTIDEDGTASLLSFASQHGTFEGEVFLGEGDPHRFDGTEPESGLVISVGLEYDESADTLTLVYPSEGGTYVHTRA